MPENFIEISAADAQRLGLNTGDQVKVVSASNEEGIWDLGQGQKKPMIGKVRVIQGLRPGVVAFSLGFGHWANGAGPMVIDGVAIPWRCPPGHRHPCQRRHAPGPGPEKYRPGGPGGRQRRVLSEPGEAGEGVRSQVGTGPLRR